MKPVLGIGCIDERIQRADVSGTARLLYVILLSHSDAKGRAWPSVRRLADICRCNKDSVCKAIRELEKASMLRVKRQKKAVSVYELRPCQFWKLSEMRGQKAKKTVLDEGTEKAESVLIRGMEVYAASVQVRTATRLNDGALLEPDFWTFFCSLPFNGAATGDYRLVPNDVKRSSNAKQLLRLAWELNPWWKASCVAISEWYSWPWNGSAQDKRVSSIRKLVNNWKEQVDLANIAIEARAQFRVVAHEVDNG